MFTSGAMIRPEGILFNRCWFGFVYSETGLITPLRLGHGCSRIAPCWAKPERPSSGAQKSAETFPESSSYSRTFAHGAHLVQNRRPADAGRCRSSINGILNPVVPRASMLSVVRLLARCHPSLALRLRWRCIIRASMFG